MKKTDMIKQLKKVNPLRSATSWNKCSYEEIQDIYNEALKLRAI